jgi:gluconolactonase
VIEPNTLDQRRAAAKVCFNWYRIKITIPERVGNWDPTGSTVAFEVVVDDYAEVWVDGKLAHSLGQSGGSVVRGFNAPNRVILTRDARPGASFQIALFGINGPISQSPENFIWVKSATLDFHKSTGAKSTPSFGSVERLDPALDAAVPLEPTIERLAAGFQFTEGPAWNAEEQTLFFSDPNQNTIYRYDGDGALSIFRTKSGYRGLDIGDYTQPGSNGLAFDKSGRLAIDEHGNRRVTRLEKNGVLTVLADQFEGKRLNSPNDLVYRSDGTLYFTDPPFGLPKAFEDPRKELPFSGIFRILDGKLSLLSRDLLGPNGLAFSPDEKFLYVDNWDPKRKVVLRYEVAADGSLGESTVFLDATSAEGEEAFDGLKVDRLGNVYVSGPGGVWILGPSGRHIGTIHASELPANFAWGDRDGKALYMTARTGVYRIRLNVAGATAFGPT